jgi:hypothetical protein
MSASLKAMQRFWFLQLSWRRSDYPSRLENLSIAPDSFFGELPCRHAGAVARNFQAASFGARFPTKGAPRSARHAFEGAQP